MPFSALAALAGLFGSSPATPGILTDREIRTYARVKRCYPDCDSNFIAYLIVAYRSRPLPPVAETTPSTSHATQRKRRAKASAASKPARLSTTAIRPKQVSTGRALTERVVEKIEAFGQLYPREPTPDPSPAETTTAYANYCLDVLNSVFPSWSVAALRDWLTVAIFSQPALTITDRPLATASPCPAIPHGVTAVFPDRMVDEYFDHCDHCLQRSDVDGVASSLWPTAWLRNNITNANSGHEAMPMQTRTISRLPSTCSTHLCPPTETGRRLRPGHIPTHQYFRSPQYREGALARLLNAFPRLYRSTIEAVLAEHYMDYCATYYALRHLSETQPRSWVVDSVLNLLPSRTQHSDQPSMFHVDLLLDVDQLHAQRNAETLARDAAYAREVNETEYRAAAQLIACECCCDDVVFEDLAPCTASDQAQTHLCCKDCIRRFVQEAVHGQGGRGLQQRVTSADIWVGCIGDSDCLGWYTDGALQRALPVTLYAQWHQWLQAQSLDAWRATVDPWTVAQCPACAYVELVPRALTYTRWSLAARIVYVLGLGFLLVLSSFWLLYSVIPLLPAGADHLLLYCLIFCGTTITSQILIHQYQTGRVAHRVHAMWEQANARTPPRLLRCRNPNCGWRPCPMCLKNWTPDHQCGESARESLRRYVERAMDEAVKRTECTRCDLYHCENDEITRQHAAEQAQSAFLAASAHSNIDTDDALREPLTVGASYCFANPGRGIKCIQTQNNFVIMQIQLFFVAVVAALLSVTMVSARPIDNLLIGNLACLNPHTHVAYILAKSWSSCGKIEVGNKKSSSQATKATMNSSASEFPDVKELNVVWN
ncbi:hypothetical protein H4R34_004650 [Dimargaris verticillata]|uniref:E3 ubiquitin-protein ligase RNF216 RING finger HC subclass domain-containing protein n=1 Tax=Dimargaris verticillata TaxID=2761393 RepID=A0A9W8B255_9FUNG|nr:hypothetical protein H4R34_004650 [Dimargaris verticillata]